MSESDREAAFRPNKYHPAHPGSRTYSSYAGISLTESSPLFSDAIRSIDAQGRDMADTGDDAISLLMSYSSRHKSWWYLILCRSLGY